MLANHDDIKNILDIYKYKITGVRYISDKISNAHVDFYKSLGICEQEIELISNYSQEGLKEKNYLHLDLINKEERILETCHSICTADFIHILHGEDKMHKIGSYLNTCGFSCVRYYSMFGIQQVETAFVRKILPKLSLCIPTYKRWSYLKDSLPMYYKNPYIHEIVINDEDGSDNRLIYQNINHEKLRLFSNTQRLYVYLNKQAALNNSSNKWVCLFDSDNFAPYTYFDAWGAAFEDDARIIYAPCRTLPQREHPGFDFRNLQNVLIDKHNYKQIFKLPSANICLNTANFIVHKDTYLKAKCFSGGGKSHSLDSMYKNYLMFHLCDARMKVVEKMEYYHDVHPSSSWLVMLKETDEDYFNSLYQYNPTYEMTLFEWQQTVKSRMELLYNCSECGANDDWVRFPIGMGWNIINYVGDMRHIQIGPHEDLLLCAIQDWTDKRRRPLSTTSSQNRTSILSTLQQKGIVNTQLHFQDYFLALPHFKFVISPEGNGVDCHRHYEALLAGAIPIVEEHPGIREKYAGCPILFTKDYSEITPTYLTSKYEEMLHTKFDFSRLMLSTYDKKSQEEIKRNGNYWAQRHFGINWH